MTWRAEASSAPTSPGWTSPATPTGPSSPGCGSCAPNVTAYDAVYLALAEVLDAPLLTFDQRLAAAPGHGAGVEVLT